MDRIMSYLTDESLDVMLSIALRVARRLGCRCVEVAGCWCWVGPELPWSVVALLEEYKARHTRHAVRRRVRTNGR
jgi:hypothetical protein